MGAWGAIIMGFFGAAVAAMTMAWQLGIGGGGLATPFLGFAAIGLAAWRILRLPGEGIVPSERVGRIILWSSIGEGIGLFLAANIVINLHRPDLLLPAMALVVGLHFLPIAFAARFLPFHVLGWSLVAAALAGFGLAAPTGGAVSGFAAALALWTAALLALRRDWRAKRASAAGR